MPAAQSFSPHQRAGICWRLVEAQHKISTMKLTGTLEEQSLLEELLETSKPPVPRECAHLHYLLSTPFRYAAYRGGSRFRRAGHTPGVFYASEREETAFAEIAFYRLLFFAESPDTPLPENPLEFTAFSASYKSNRAIDLTKPPLVKDEEKWTSLDNYEACQNLAGAARNAGIELIAYKSVRCPGAGINVALLTCYYFDCNEPHSTRSWRLKIGKKSIVALPDARGSGLSFSVNDFAADPRISGNSD